MEDEQPEEAPSIGSLDDEEYVKLVFKHVAQLNHELDEKTGISNHVFVVAAPHCDPDYIHLVGHVENALAITQMVDSIQMLANTMDTKPKVFCNLHKLVIDWIRANDPDMLTPPTAH
jgi:hypothetical protein